jgi:hypothetical protein
MDLCFLDIASMFSDGLRFIVFCCLWFFRDQKKSEKKSVMVQSTAKAP